MNVQLLPYLGIFSKMGVPYKLNSQIIDYIIQKKRTKPSLSCRKLAELVLDKFKIQISKSAVNNIIKKARLSSAVGRSRVRPRGETEGFINRAGGIFLLAADAELDLVRSLAEGLFPGQSLRKLRKISIILRSLTYLPLFDITIDKLDSYDKKDLWEMAGGRVSSGILSRFIKQSAEKYNYSDIAKIVPKYAQYAHFGLFDGSVFYIDAQFKAIWPSFNIPTNLNITSCITMSYIKNMFIESNQPIIVLCPGPIGASGKKIGIAQEIMNFILSCEGIETKNISRTVIHSPTQELNRFSYIPAKKRYFIFGLFPAQQSRHKIKLNRLVKKITAFAGMREYFVQDGEIIFPQPIVKQQVKLRAGLLKKSPKDKTGIVLVSNISSQAKSIEDIAQLYLQRWPEPEDYFTELTNRTIFSKQQEGLHYHNYININKLEHIFPITMDNLNTYAQQRYFPPQYHSWDFAKMKKSFYELGGRISLEREFIMFKLFYPASQPEFAHEQGLIYAAQRINESNIIISGKRLILQPEKTTKIQP